MKKLEVTFRVVTPMFMGGADPAVREELRPPSIKGVLRFWFRAIYPKDYTRNESRIFGGTDKHEGQARLLLRVSSQQLTHGEKNNTRWSGTNIPYLGYGIIDHGGCATRPYIKEESIRENSRFTLTVHFKPPCNDEQERTYKNDKLRVGRTIWAMTMFGGLGARSRKGFGSLAVVSQTGLDDLPTLMPRNDQELQESIRDFVSEIDLQDSSLPATPAEHTCFSTDARCVITGNSETAESVFIWLADAVHGCRSYRSRTHYQATTDDHDLMNRFISSGVVSDPPMPPKRAAFGLPHNYFFSRSQKKGGVDYMEGGKKGRRASPVFFKICDFEGSGACVIATFLPARLIPEGGVVTLTGDCNNRGCLYETTMPLPNDFHAVTELLKTLGGKGVLP